MKENEQNEYEEYNLLNKKKERKQKKKSKTHSKIKKNKLEKVEPERKEVNSEKKKMKLENISLLDNSDKLFIGKKVDNYLDIINNWKNKIKSIKVDSGVINSKLKPNELSFKNCNEIALEKIKKAKTIEDIYQVLSYDNTNDIVLYYSLKKLMEKGINEIDKYKYCFSSQLKCKENSEILNLDKEFNYSFLYKNEEEIKKKLLSILNLLLTISKEDDNINNTFTLNENGNIIQEKESQNKINSKEYEFIKYYENYLDFPKYLNNQPFNYNNNKILYFNNLIYKIYSLLINYDDTNKISISKKNLDLVGLNDELIESIISDLENNNLSFEFFMKIKFLILTLEVEEENIQYSDLSNEFAMHIFDKKSVFIKEDAENFKKIKMTMGKINKANNYIYNVSDNDLQIKNINGKKNNNNVSIIFSYNEYPKILMNELLYTYNMLPYKWKRNTLRNFQTNNFLNAEDIEYLKQIIRIILQSNFWTELEKEYLSDEFIYGNIFQNEDVINEFFEKIKFAPFNPLFFHIFAYTFSEDLEIIVSGYPLSIINSDYFSSYKVNRVLTMSLLVIIILHEGIHYIKRLLYYITCGIISRETILKGKKMEGGWIFENLIFGWGDNENDDYYIKNISLQKKKKINLETAFKILNPESYSSTIKEFKNIIYNHNEVKINDNFKLYLNKIDINNDTELSDFIKNNKNNYINATRKIDANFAFEYSSSNHLKTYTKNKNRTIKILSLKK